MAKLAKATKIITPVNIKDRQSIEIRSGDTVRVWQKIEERGKTRLQAFEGLVLARKHGNEPGATFTVRRTSGGVGVEKIFPLYSPAIDKIEIVRRAKVRRAKLYHIREKAAREIRRQMRNMRIVDISTESDLEVKAEQAKKAEEKSKADEAEAEVKEEVKQEAPTNEENKKEEPKQEEKTEETKPESEDKKEE